MNTENLRKQTSRLSAAQVRSLKFTFAGFSIAGLILLLFVGSYAFMFFPYILYAAISLGAMSYLSGNWINKFMSRGRMQALTFGTLYAWGIMVLPVILIGTTTALFYFSDPNPFDSWLLKPLFWIVAVGLIPSTVLGLLFGEMSYRTNTVHSGIFNQEAINNLSQI